MDNQERAEHAGNAITEYLASKGEPHDQPAEAYEISDLICDLLHHGDRFGFEHRDILERALMHYAAERAEAEKVTLKSEKAPAAGVPQSLRHGNALQEASLAFARIEKAAWLALEELQMWHAGCRDDEGTAQALKALEEALSA